MTYSVACEYLVKHFEGLLLIAYLCPSGIWTIGWGHTNNVHEGDKIFEPQAEVFFAEDMGYVANTLVSMLPSSITLSQPQFDALASLCFNIRGGPRALPHLAPKLWANLMAGNVTGAAQQFLDIDHALVNGTSVKLPGLRKRRAAEAALFLS